MYQMPIYMGFKRLLEMYNIYKELDDYGEKK